MRDIYCFLFLVSPISVFIFIFPSLLILSHTKMMPDVHTELKTIVQEGPLVVSPKGSDVRLTCAINYAPQEESSSSHVLWSRDNKLLNYDTSGRWFVWTERLQINDSSSSSASSSLSSSSNSSSVFTPSLLSHLLIRTTDSSDSGNYSCQIHAPNIDSSHSRPAHVQLHVLNGKENPAAIHGSGSAGGGGSQAVGSSSRSNNSAASAAVFSSPSFMRRGRKSSGVPFFFFSNVVLFLSSSLSHIYIIMSVFPFLIVWRSSCSLHPL